MKKLFDMFYFLFIFSIFKMIWCYRMVCRQTQFMSKIMTAWITLKNYITHADMNQSVCIAGNI